MFTSSTWKYCFNKSIPRTGWAYNRHNLGDTPLNIEPPGEEEYLFNPDDDPRETNNLAGYNPDKLRKMRILLEEVRESPLQSRYPNQ